MNAPVDTVVPFSEFLREQGDIGRSILRKDWGSTSLGPLENWPVSLRTVLRMTLTTNQPIVFFWGPDLHQFYNLAYEPILNGMPPDPIGAPFLEYWAEVMDGVGPYFERTMRGESCGAKDLPLTLTRNNVTEETFWTFFYSPLHDDDGSIAGFLNIVHETSKSVVAHRDVTHAKELLEEENRRTRAALESKEKAEKRQYVLQRELSHRMKNSLAMVQAIVSQTLRHSATVDGAGQAIIARIQALAQAQDVLTRTSWERTDVGNVVASALAPHRRDFEDERIQFGGPHVALVAEQGLGLALAIHELATNAVRYGALSNDGGVVQVRWMHANNRFEFHWKESVGFELSSLRPKGFGSRLLERIVPSYFAGTGTLVYEQAGVEYHMNGQLRSDD